MRYVFIVFALAAAALAQPALAPPQVGFLKDGTNSVHPVFGIAGNFLVGDPAFDGVVAAAYSGSFALLKTDTSVIAMDNQAQVLAAMDAPLGPAAFAFFKDGSPAFVYLLGPNLLFQWYGRGFQMIPFDCRLFPASAVLGISAPDAAHVVFLIQNDNGLQEIRVLVESGELDSQTALPGVNAPALRLATSELVYADANGLVIRKTDASEVHLNALLPANFSLAQMGADWAELSDVASTARFAIRVTPGHEGFYALPEVSQ